jgi:hypothetical protein
VADDIKGGIVKRATTFFKNKTNNFTFPISTLLNDYNIDLSDLFTFRLQAIQNEPPVFERSDSSGIVVKDVGKTKLFDFEIIYKNSSIQIDHNHDWEDMPMFSTEGAVTNLGGLIKKYSSLGIAGTAITALNAIFAEGSDKAKGATRKNSFGSLDTAPIYKGSGKQSITLQFTLMAHNNPVSEVVIPSLLLTYMTYPKSSTRPEGIIDAMTKALTEEKNKIEQQLKVGEDEGSKAKLNAINKVASNVINTFGIADKDTWRFVIGAPPPKWTISASNGIYHLEKCHCKSINITYHGPWIKPPDGTTVGNMLGQIANKSTVGLGELSKSVFPNSTEFSKDFLTGTKSDTPLKGLPSYADVSMTFEADFDQLFGEEFLLGAAGFGGGKVNVSFNR